MLCDWPLWLYAALTAKPRRASAPRREAHGSTPYGAAALKGLLDEISSAGDGARNDTLNTATFRAGQLHAGGELPDVREQLLAASTDDDERKSADTVERAWAAGMKEPASAPPPEAKTTSIESVAIDEQHTDLGNARRLVRLHGANLRHTQARGWFVWDGTRFAVDETGASIEVAKRSAQSFWDEVKASGSDKALVRHALASQSQRSLGAALALASSESLVAHRPGDFDTHHDLLNCTNGTLRLSTGELLPHNPKHLITRRVNAAYRPDAECPAWDGFLGQILPDPEMRSYLQRYAGYSLHGDKTAQCFAVLYGKGSNGKSTFLDVLCNVMGDYATTTPFETFLKRQPGQATNDLARLAGARLVRATEPEQAAVLSEATIKNATGGEPITARFLHREFFEFQPEFALWLAGNHKPQIRGTDHGIWRRVHLAPFTVRIDAPDLNLKARLLDERDGILSWAVRGYAAYKALGLTPPKAVKDATAEYRSEQDSLGSFLEDRCVLGIEQECYTTDLRSAYAEWCKASDEYCLAQKDFGAQLRDRGCEPFRTNAGRKWRGLSLKQKPANVHDESSRY